jgi:hypothetical protein
MSKFKGPMSAEELVKQLQDDPRFLREEAQREKKWRRLKEADARIESPILVELNFASFRGESIQAVVENHAPLPDEAVAILLRWQRTLNQQDLDDGSGHARLSESIVRALAATTISFDGRPLTECFEKTSDESLKWAIANTIALKNPHSIDGWVVEKLKHPYWGKKLRELGLNW